MSRTSRTTNIFLTVIRACADIHLNRKRLSWLSYLDRKRPKNADQFPSAKASVLQLRIAHCALAASRDFIHLLRANSGNKCWAGEHTTMIPTLREI